MKKLLFFLLILIASSCGDESFTSRDRNPVSPGSSSNSPLILPCPYGNNWMMKATAAAILYNPIFDVEVPYGIKPIAFQASNHGATAGTFTLSIKNNGNLPMKYRVSPSDPWINLAVNATNTFTKTINPSACGATPLQEDYSIRIKTTSCPVIIFGSIWKLRAEVKLIAVDGNYNLLATCAQTIAAGESCNTVPNGFQIDYQSSQTCPVIP